jgi:protein-disulfide isomerase
MNIKRITFWLTFIAIIGLITWGMIAASNKAVRETGSLPLPNQIVDTDWVKGSPLAPVTIVEYSDFQCPACSAYFPIVQKIISENKNDVRFVYRHFPLPQHLNAIPAAKAAEAAGKQGKFWDMYEMIFTNHDIWENSTDVKTIFDDYAVKIGLDINKYNLDYSAKETKDKINSDIKAGQKVGINSTPTFYVNGIKIKNPQGYDEFKKIVNEAIKKTIKP